MSIDEELQDKLQHEFDRVIAEWQEQIAETDRQTREIERETEQIESGLHELQTRNPLPQEQGRGLFGKRRLAKAERQRQGQLVLWQVERDAAAERLSFARSFEGDRTGDLLLKPGEAIFATITGASLVEERRGAGHWEGRSSGFSIPIGSIGGRSVRYRTGRSRGHEPDRDSLYNVSIFFLVDPLGRDGGRSLRLHFAALGRSGALRVCGEADR